MIASSMNGGCFSFKMLSSATPDVVVKTIGFLDNEAAANVKEMDEYARVKMLRGLIETFMLFNEDDQVRVLICCLCHCLGVHFLQWGKRNS